MNVHSEPLTSTTSRDHKETAAAVTSGEADVLRTPERWHMDRRQTRGQRPGGKSGVGGLSSEFEAREQDLGRREARPPSPRRRLARHCPRKQMTCGEAAGVEGARVMKPRRVSQPLTLSLHWRRMSCETQDLGAASQSCTSKTDKAQ